MRGASLVSAILPAKQPFLVVDPTRLELVTSAMRGRRDGLLEISEPCKNPANSRVSVFIHFLSLQEIYSGCCTVAAQI
jgi:hypothetical protein